MTDDLIGDISRREQIENLLFKNLPNHRTEDGTKIDTAKLREDLDMTRQGINFWFTRGRISYFKMKELTELDGSTLTLEMLLPFTDAVR